MKTKILVFTVFLLVLAGFNTIKFKSNEKSVFIHFSDRFIYSCWL